jgi:hypothetical protein
MLNNAPVVHALGKLLETEEQPMLTPVPRRRVTSETCLPERLPSGGLSELQIVCMLANMI